MGVPVDTSPKTAEVGIFETGGPAKERAALALEKYPSRTTLARPAASTHVVVIATAELPVAVPPATKVKLTVVGVAAIVMVSPSVAFSVIFTEFEFSWENAAGKYEKRIKLVRKLLKAKPFFLRTNMGGSGCMLRFTK